jgi:hypothetical protein
MPQYAQSTTVSKDQGLTERWYVEPGVWVDIQFHGVPTWRGIRMMVRRLLLLIPERGVRIYER